MATIRGEFSNILTPVLKEMFNNYMEKNLLMPSKLFSAEPRKPLRWWERYLSRMDYFGYRLRRAWLVLMDREDE